MTRFTLEALQMLENHPEVESGRCYLRHPARCPYFDERVVSWLQRNPIYPDVVMAFLLGVGGWELADMLSLGRRFHESGEPVSLSAGYFDRIIGACFRDPVLITQAVHLSRFFEEEGCGVEWLGRALYTGAVIDVVLPLSQVNWLMGFLEDIDSGLALSIWLALEEAVKGEVNGR